MITVPPDLMRSLLLCTITNKGDRNKFAFRNVPTGSACDELVVIQTHHITKVTLPLTNAIACIK